MSADLSTQLERYVAAVAADQEEISVAEVQPPLPVIGELSSPPSRDRRSVGRGVVAAVAAGVVLLVLVGGVAWLTRSDDTGEPATPTTTLAPPDTTPLTLIPAPPPESLNQSQIRFQASFLAAFRDREFWSSQCGRRRGEPKECTVQIDSPTLGGPATRTFTVPMPGNKEEALTGDAVRSVAEEGLAALYVWALETYPDETAARCRVGFEGNDTAVAWSPGYKATPACGDHLAGLLFEFNPPEAPELPEPPDPTAGLLSHVETSDPEGVALGALFDVADTPVGLLATVYDGLWISQDAVEWRPYARDSVDLGETGFSMIAVSDLGIVVSKPEGDEPASWFSPDGEEWTLIEGLRLKLSRAGPLTASNERFLAIDEDGRVVSSTNGLTWQTVEDLPPADFHLVAATPLGYYAENDDGIWRSLDGVAWENLPASIDGSVYEMAGTQTGLVAVSWEGRAWHTADGTMWTEIQVLPQGDGECTRVSASDSGFLVTTVLRSPSGSPWVPRTPDLYPAAWISEDGRRWARVPIGPGDDQPEPDTWHDCFNELIPYQDGFLGVTDGGPPVWRYER